MTEERFVLRGRRGWWLVLDSAYCYTTMLETQYEPAAVKMRDLLNSGRWDEARQYLDKLISQARYLRDWKGQWTK